MRFSFSSGWFAQIVCGCTLVLTSSDADAQSLAKHLASPAPPALVNSAGQCSLQEFVELANEIFYAKFKSKVVIDAKAFEAKYPDFPFWNAQLNLTDIPTGMHLATVLQATVDQLPVPATFTVQGDTVKIFPGRATPLKDMSKTSPLTAKLVGTKIKLEELDNIVKFKTLIDFIASKSSAPIYIDSVPFRSKEPDAPPIGVLEIDIKKIKNGNAFQVMQEAINQLKESYPGIRLLIQSDHLRVTRPTVGDVKSRN